MINITTEQLIYFLTLSKYKNFSIASNELCISQSSLSKHIKALEIELNTILFDRNTRSINLTPSGEEFCKYAKKAVNEYNNIQTKLKKFNNTHIVLNIGSIPVTAQYSIISAISNFKNLYPYIDINIFEDNNYNILHRLMKNELNFALIRDFNLSTEVFNKTPLVNDELVMVVSKNHPLAEKNSVSLLDIKEENFILLGPNSGIYERCINEFNKHSISINIVSTFYKIETIIGLVSENMGVTLLMKEVLNSFNTSNVSIIKLIPSIKASLSLVYLKSKDLSNEEILFSNYIKNTLASK